MPHIHHSIIPSFHHSIIPSFHHSNAPRSLQPQIHPNRAKSRQIAPKYYSPGCSSELPTEKVRAETAGLKAPILSVLVHTAHSFEPSRHVTTLHRRWSNCDIFSQCPRGLRPCFPRKRAGTVFDGRFCACQQVPLWRPGRRVPEPASSRSAGSWNLSLRDPTLERT
jgi:hypothetical protein